MVPFTFHIYASFELPISSHSTPYCQNASLWVPHKLSDFMLLKKSIMDNNELLSVLSMDLSVEQCYINALCYSFSILFKEKVILSYYFTYLHTVISGCPINNIFLKIFHLSISFSKELLDLMFFLKSMIVINGLFPLRHQIFFFFHCSHIIYINLRKKAP